MRKLFYPKTKAGDYADSDRGSLRDFFLSLLPRNEALLALQVAFIWSYVSLLSNWSWEPFSQIRFEQPWEIFYLAGFLVIFFSTLSLIANILRAEVFFTFQIIAGAIATILIVCKHTLGGVGLTWAFVPGYAWLAFNLSTYIFATNNFRVWYFPLSVSRRMRPKGFPPRQAGRHRILFIDPGNESLEWSISPRRREYPSILPYVAALVPEDWDVMILDEIHDEIDYDIDVDIVGLTTMGRFFADTREICEEFQRRGKTTIVGGPDCSIKPESYFGFTDAILRGNAEGILPKLLDDWKTGNLQKIYKNPDVFNLKGMPLPRYDLLPLRRYSNYHNILVSTSCPFNCAFCSYNRTREPRLRPPEEVLAAVKATPAKYFWFEAPELLAYKKYIRELELAFKGHRVHFSTHASMRSASDPETVRMAYKAGLRSVWLGLESYNQSALDFANKKMNKVVDYAKTFKVLSRAGISMSVHMMFGFPTDTKQDYENALKGVVRGGTSFVGIHLLGIYAGDEEFEKNVVAAGGRELDLLVPLNNKADLGYTFYKPIGFSDREFANAVEKFNRSYYSFWNIARRLFPRSWRGLPNFPYDLLTNIVFKCYGRNILGNPFDVAQAIREFFNLPAKKNEELFKVAPPQSTANVS